MEWATQQDKGVNVRFSAVIISVLMAISPLFGAEFLVIAHRGASGYLPEHTLAAKALAYGLGADFIEQDVVLTKDDHPVILHDIHLETVTDVARRFPDRARADGRFYVVDLTLSEIRTLSVHERIDSKTGKRVFPNRFAADQSTFHIPTLTEEIELIQGLNGSMGRNVGLYVEIKRPAWHRKEGHDISRIVLSTLTRKGYRQKSDNIFVQCFEPRELMRIRGELGCPLRLVQLIDRNKATVDIDYDSMCTPAGLKIIASYANGIGPSINRILPTPQNAQTVDLVSHAHRLGLVVHPFTFRVDDLPPGFTDAARLMRQLRSSGVDGVFTDFPDVTLQHAR